MTANQRGRLFASRTTLSRSAYRVKSHGDRVLLTATSVNIPSTAVRQNARHRDIYGRATRHRSMCCRMRERAWREPGGMPMSDRRAQTGHEAARPQERGRAPAGRASSAAWCSIEGASYRRVNHPLLNSPSRQIPQRNISTPTGRSLMDAPGKQYWPEQTSVCPRDPRMQRIRPNSHDVLHHKRASDVRTCPKPLSRQGRGHDSC